MASVRRNLRTTNTCPCVQNPAHFSKSQLPLSELLPFQIARFISNSHTLTCSQIINLPTLSYQCTLEEALTSMQKATQWQQDQVEGKTAPDYFCENSYQGVQVHKQFKTTPHIGEEGVKQERSDDQGQYMAEMLAESELKNYSKTPFDLRQFNHNQLE